MIFKSQVLTQASGSVGGITYSHNAGGMYQRARAIPTNPNTPEQQTIRGAVTSLTNLWINSLSPAQRSLWETYAANVSVLNRLGEPIFLSGLNMYVRSNVPRIQGGDPRVDNGPTTFDIGDYSNPSFAIDEAANEVDVTFTDTDTWVDEDDTAMMIWASRPQNTTINFFKGPYRFAGKIDGDSITPPTSPAVIALPFPVIAGQRVFVRANVTRADGRLSAPFRGFGDG